MVMVTNVMEVVTDKEVQQFDKKSVLTGGGGGGGGGDFDGRVSSWILNRTTSP